MTMVLHGHLMRSRRANLMRTAGKRHREENQKSHAVRFMRKEWIGTPASTYFISFCHFLIFSFLHFCYSCEKRLSDILGSLLKKLLQFVIEIVYECERDEGLGMLWELCELLISSLFCYLSYCHQ